MSKRIPLAEVIGQRFGMLVPISEIEPKRNRSRTFKCACECGQFSEADLSNLRSGNSTSCGCTRPKSLSSSKRTHGLSGKTPEYRIWLQIKARCLNPKNKDYKFYGAIGRTICPEWQISFTDFLEHVGYRPTKDHWLDRVDNTKDYEPGNMEWRLPVQQARNRKNTILATIDGVTRCLPEWCDIYEADYSKVYHHFRTEGKDLESVLTAYPKRK